MKTFIEIFKVIILLEYKRCGNPGKEKGIRKNEQKQSKDDLINVWKKSEKSTKLGEPVAKCTAYINEDNI